MVFGCAGVFPIRVRTLPSSIICVNKRFARASVSIYILMIYIWNKSIVACILY